MYFLCYVPFTALTKALSSGLVPGLPAVDGAAILPASTAASVVVTFLFLFASGWWRDAGKVQLGGLSLPAPSRWTALSGACTAVILVTATLAYTFEGVSIVFAMLLMRGGVLAIAPVVDLLSHKRPRPAAWIALALCGLALIVATSEVKGFGLSVPAGIDIGLYLAAYFVRLRLIDRLGKATDPAVTRRYFAEEQLVVAPFTLVMLGLLALWGEGALMTQLHDGFTGGVTGLALLLALLIGAFSQGTGIFGTLIFLDPRESSFAVPVNRSASVLAGVVATTILALTLGADVPSARELLGAGLVVLAVVVLSRH